MTNWKTELVLPSPRIAVDHIGSGPLVICLHGIGGNRTNWHDQLRAFSSHFHAAAWDARGYGESDDYEGPLDFADFSRDLLRVLDFFAAQRAHLVGLSMGGLIAMDFCLSYPRARRDLDCLRLDAGLQRRVQPGAGARVYPLAPGAAAGGQNAGRYCSCRRPLASKPGGAPRLVRATGGEHVSTAQAVLLEGNRRPRRLCPRAGA